MRGQLSPPWTEPITESKSFGTFYLVFGRLQHGACDDKNTSTYVNVCSVYCVCVNEFWRHNSDLFNMIIIEFSVLINMFSWR